MTCKWSNVTPSFEVLLCFGVVVASSGTFNRSLGLVDLICPPPRYCRLNFKISSSIAPTSLRGKAFELLMRRLTRPDFAGSVILGSVVLLSSLGNYWDTSSCLIPIDGLADVDMCALSFLLIKFSIVPRSLPSAGFLFNLISVIFAASDLKLL